MTPSRMRRRLPMLCLGFVFAAGHSHGAATAFPEALADAKANLKTPEGVKYDTDFGRQFGKRYVDTLSRCTKDTAKEDLTQFDVLVRVSKEGAPEEVLVEPASKVATCLSDEVRKGKFLEPPKASYWVRVEMKMKP
jgi:hypothetical protein